MSKQAQERLDALRELLAKVEAGKSLWEGYSDYHTLQPYHALISDAYHGSLDAAKALHEAVLLGWWWKAISPDPHYVQVGRPNIGVYSGYSDNPARAWLIAILKALIRKEEAQ